MPEVLLHFDVNGGSLCAKSYSFDYIDFLSFLRNTTKRRYTAYAYHN